MSSRTMKIPAVALGCLLSITSRVAADADDPPGRIARLSYSNGAVSLGPAGTEEWVDANPNRPLSIGDKLWVDGGAKAELHVGAAAIRLSGGTGISFLDLTDDAVQVELTTGVAAVHLRQLEQDETFEIDTPNLALDLLRPGDYRIEANDSGDVTVVSIRNGQGEVTGGDQAYKVRSGQRATFSGVDRLESYVENLGDSDGFDRWCAERDRRDEQSTSARYVSRDVIGYQDLDDAGDWRDVPEYGAVWVPRSMAVDWAPYRYGHWVWISPWGWTWVDDAPWGFAPFHYGRWVNFGDSWGWSPGPAVVAGAAVRPVYAPALVAWVGGSSFGIGATIGGRAPDVAWFPLAPREVYVPPYHVSREYVTRVNVTNTTVNNVAITNVYENKTQVNDARYVNRLAVTATPRAAFASGQPIARNTVRVDRAQIAQAHVTNDVGVLPQQASVVGPASIAAARPPAGIQSRVVVARRAPPPAPPPFATQQRAIQANGGKPLGRAEAQRLEPQQRVPSVKVAAPAAGSVAVEPPARQERPQPTVPSSPPPPRPPSPPTRPVAEQPTAAVPSPAPRPADRPPAAQPHDNNASDVNANRASAPVPPQPSPTVVQLEQKHQQAQQRLMEQQEQRRQLLEQRHQQQQQKAGEQAENQRQQAEHEKLRLQQQQQLEQLQQKQLRERQRVQQQEAKQKEKQPPKPPPNEKPQ